MVRWLARIALAIAVLVALLIAASIWFAEPLVRAGLRAAGVETLQFEALSLGLTGAEVTGIRLGSPPSQEIARLTLDYRPRDLLAGRVATITLDGLRLQGRIGEQGLELAGLEATSERGADELPPLPMPERLIVRDARLDLSTPFGELDAQLRLEGSVDDEGRMRLRTTRLILHGRDLRWQDLELHEVRLEATAEGALSDLSGEARLELEGEGSPLPDLAVSGLALEQQLAFARTPSSFTLTLEPGGTLQLDRIAWADLLQADTPRLALEAADDPLLVLESDGGRITSWRHALSIRAELPSLRLTLPAPLALEAAIRDLQLGLAGDGGGLRQGRIVLGDGRLLLPEQDLSLDGIRTEIELGPAGLAPGQAAPFTIAAISHGRQPPSFLPLKLQAYLRPSRNDIAFDGRLSDRTDRLSLRFEGAHELSAATGGASIALAPLTFAPGELQPVDLLPGLGRQLQRVSGRLSADGELTWGDKGLAGELALLLDDIDLSTGPARLEQLNGVVRFDRLWPLSTPPRQQLSVALLDVGLPLARGFATFQLEPDGRLAVERLRFRWAGGTLRAEPFSLGSDGSPISFMLRAEGLGLAEILDQVRLDDLSGEGRISGLLPITIDGSEAMINGGELEAQGPGWLRYRPAGTPDAFQAGGQGLDLLLEALENFRYEELRITLDGRTDSDMDIGLHIKGANPDLYDGYPIEFNLNLEGELGNILRSGLKSYQMPERLRERMREGERR